MLELKKIHTDHLHSRLGYKTAVFVLCLTTLMSAIDTSIVNVGLPTIAKEFGTNFSSVQWIILSYSLAVTSLIVGIGRIGDIFGKKKLYIFGIVLFTVTSLLCGTSASIYQLIIFRAFQGIGGSILIALSFAIVGDVVPKEKTVGAMAAINAVLPVGMALGPALGGLLISSFGWRFIFLLNVPIGILALLLMIKFPPVPISEKFQKFDIWGMLLLAATLSAYILSVTLAENQGISLAVVVTAAIAVAGIASFIIIEKKTAFPLLHLDMFKDVVFSTSLIITVVLFTAINGFSTIFPFYLQQAKNFPASVSGLLLMSGPIGAAIFSPIASSMANRLGNAKVMTFGILMIGFGMFIMSSFGISTGVIVIVVTIFLCNGCLSFFQTPNSAFIMLLAKPEQRGLISGLLNLARTTGQTTGTAVIGAIFYYFANTKSMTTAKPANIVGGIDHTFLVTMFIVAGAFVLGLIAYQPWKTVKSCNM